MIGYRTLLLNLLAFVGTYIAAQATSWSLDPVWVAAIIAGLNIAKRYLAVPDHGV